MVNLDLSKPRPQQVLVDLEGESEISVSISYDYENVPCSLCFSNGHRDGKCKTPLQQIREVIPEEVQLRGGILGKAPVGSAVVLKTVPMTPAAPVQELPSVPPHTASQPEAIVQGLPALLQPAAVQLLDAASQPTAALTSPTTLMSSSTAGLSSLEAMPHTPVLDTSNPFSKLEHCIDHTTYATSFSSLLPAGQLHLEPTQLQPLQLEPAQTQAPNRDPAHTHPPHQEHHEPTQTQPPYPEPTNQANPNRQTGQLQITSDGTRCSTTDSSLANEDPQLQQAISLEVDLSSYSKKSKKKMKVVPQRRIDCLYL